MGIPIIPVDLNHLEYYDLVPNMPAVRPRYVVAVPPRADTWAALGYVHVYQLGATTLDTYSAPGQKVVPGALGQSQAIPGNGIVLAGNAPYQGIYTGIQQE